jgi:predicted site-specific integrase-resolvase
MMNEKQIYTDKEASDYLRISQVTLWRERKKGKISFRRAASKIIYTQADLENYLESTKRNAFGLTEVFNGQK